MSADAAMRALETACAAAGIDLEKKYDRKTRRENYSAAIDRYELCRLALPVIFTLKIANDSRLKYARCAIMLASEQSQYTGVQALCADAVRATCGVKRASSIPNNAKMAITILKKLCVDAEGNARELTAAEQAQVDGLESLRRDDQARMDSTKTRAPPLALFRSRIEEMPLSDSEHRSFVSLLRLHMGGDEEAGAALKSIPYDELCDHVMLVTRAYAVPARSNMFLSVQWGYRRENDDADGTFRLHPNYGLSIDLGRDEGSVKNGFPLSISTHAPAMRRLESHGLVDTNLVYAAVRLLSVRRDSDEDTGFVFSLDLAGTEPMPVLRPGRFFHDATGAYVSVFRRSFEQAAQDLLRDSASDFSDQDDALVHKLCQHTARAANCDYRADGPEEELPPAAWQQERPDPEPDPDPSNEELPGPSDGHDREPSPDPGGESDPEEYQEPGPDDALDRLMEAIACRGASSDIHVAQGAAALYSTKRRRGDGPDLDLARASILALERHCAKRACTARGHGE
jgi:hypothetical protein